MRERFIGGKYGIRWGLKGGVGFMVIIVLLILRDF